ncbi:hypothetical protein M378DRAFT_182494 [Amanita muscaria Koide BX008]|uniref:Uncharacterized protein n=1 Tax=Amanita muscaria (strain Koide BX008) TaxID=946122 RepID=A0A0C2RWD7_AMAMK|nr:hypothetical protein M378DRAFT_182494 [Amanita muscaria Koide BX008]
MGQGNLRPRGAAFNSFLKLIDSALHTHRQRSQQRSPQSDRSRRRAGGERGAMQERSEDLMCISVAFDNGDVVGNRELREGNSDSRLSIGLSMLFTVGIAVHTLMDSATAVPYPRERARETMEVWHSHNTQQLLPSGSSLDYGATTALQRWVRAGGDSETTGGSEWYEQLGAALEQQAAVSRWTTQMSDAPSYLFSESCDRELLYSIDGDHRGRCPFPSKRRSKISLDRKKRRSGYLLSAHACSIENAAEPEVCTLFLTIKHSLEVVEDCTNTV